jgi:hypothetical protein
MDGEAFCHKKYNAVLRWKWKFLDPCASAVCLLKSDKWKIGRGK